MEYQKPGLTHTHVLYKASQEYFIDPIILVNQVVLAEVPDPRDKHHPLVVRHMFQSNCSPASDNNCVYGSIVKTLSDVDLIATHSSRYPP